jgi:hemin uptake protein HemP
VGTLWVDTKDESIVQLQGTASKSISAFTGPTQVMRQYEIVHGFAQAKHARAVSSSFLFGQTVVTIDYQGYEIAIRATQ